MTEEELFQSVVSAEKGGEAVAVDEARRNYVERFPDGKEATNVRFRLGIATLLVGGSVPEATLFFKDAAADKKSALAKEARISLAICLNAQKKRQQAIFELKKLLPSGATPSANTASALEYLCMFVRDSGAKQVELEPIEERRREHLRVLADGEKNTLAKAQYLRRLATAFLDTGSGLAGAKAQKVLNEVIKLGPNAKEEVKAARMMLKQLINKR
ncbi:MAG: hypothetical protein GY822_29290 [Deltaproteobacteria bacterium]|nr:hypothetical protein [Deltaproteobacteria bacterium]